MKRKYKKSINIFIEMCIDYYDLITWFLILGIVLPIIVKVKNRDKK